MTDKTNAQCVRLSMLLDVTYDILFNAMRVHQNMITKIMEKELHNLATQGENNQYIINGICAFLVAISLIVIIPIFSWVIRDKSYVLAIFSDVENEELEQIISECKSLDLTSVKFKKKWIVKYADRPLDFWNKIRKSSDENKNHKVKKNQRKSKFIEIPLQEPSMLKISEDSQPVSPKNIYNNPYELPKINVKKNTDENEVKLKFENANSQNNIQNCSAEIVKVDKKAEKRMLLSEIEYF